MSKNKILVTGATGNVGREIIKVLQKKEKSFKAGVRDIKKSKEIFAENIELVNFDYQNQDTYKDAFKDVNKLFLLRPPTIVNVKDYIFPMIDFAKESGIEQIVFLSLMGVQYNPMAPHYFIEKYIKRSKIPYTFLRPSFFMQNFNTFFRESIKSDHQFFIPAGKGKTSFIDVRDIANVVQKVFSRDYHRNKIYTLTGSEALDYYEVADIFSTILGTQITYANPTSKEYKESMIKLGVPLAYIRNMTNLYFTVKVGMTKTITNDVEKILQRPPIKLNEYVKDYAELWI